MISDVMAKNNVLTAPLKNNVVIRNADSGKLEDNSTDIKDNVKKKFEETNPDLYKAMQETQKEIMKLQLEQSQRQKEQMLTQLQMQIQKTEQEMKLASFEHQKSMQNMMHAALHKLHEMDTQMWQNIHSSNMKIGEGWIKALG